MNDIWFISDTHFNHTNILKFTDDKTGVFVRPEFQDLDHMNEMLIKNWNDNVKPQDKVYHLGDVYFGAQDKGDKILERLNGRKRLVLGNHDDPKAYPVMRHFQKIVLWRIFKEHDFLVSHMPIIDQEIRKVNFNVHGHVHQHPDSSPRHHNICVEKTDYRPLHLDEVVARLKRKA